MPFRRCLRSLRNRLCLICCVGHLGQGSSSVQNQKDQDGYISALSLTFIQCAFGISLSIAQWSAKLEELSAITTIVKIIFTIFMVTSICFMIYFFKSPPEFTEKAEVWLRSQLSVGHLDVGAEHICSWWAIKMFLKKLLGHIRRFFKYKVALVGLLIFFIAGLSVDIIKVAAIMDCMDDIEHNRLNWSAVDALYHCVRMVFFVIVLAFTVKFHDAHFQAAKRVWYIISHILATAIIMWFDVILHEILRGTTDRRLSNPFTDVTTNPNFTVSINQTTSCIKGETNIYQFYYKSSNFFYALNVEFLVLAVEVIVHILHNIHNTNVQISSPNGTQVTPPHSFASFSSVEHSASGHFECGRSKAMVAMVYCYCIMIDLTLLTVAILTFSGHHDPYRIISFIFRLSLILLIFKGYQSCAEFSSIKRALSGFEYLVIFSSIGSNIFCFISIYGEIAWWLKYNDEDITLMGLAFGLLANVINIPAAFLQSTFYIHSSRLIPVDLKLPTYAWFKACLLNIAVCNLTLWAVDSFVLNQNLNATLIPKQYYSSSWGIITHLTIPLALFYRFNCFALYLRTYFLQNSYRNCEETVADIQDMFSYPSQSHETINTISESLTEVAETDHDVHDQIHESLM